MTTATTTLSEAVAQTVALISRLKKEHHVSEATILDVIRTHLTYETLPTPGSAYQEPGQRGQVHESITGEPEPTEDNDDNGNADSAQGDSPSA